MSELQKLTAKDCAMLLGISLTTAKRYISDIKKEYSIRIVTKKHLNLYLGL